MEEVRSGGGDFFFVTTYPCSGPRIFNIYCFEKTEPDLWYLRAQFVFLHSPVMRAEFIPEGEFINIVHDGKKLFRVYSAAEQTRKGRAPVSGR
jgi:hypothetical protein